MNDAIMSVMGGTLTAVSRAELLECNRISSYFGLILTPEQAEIISKHNTAALISTGRVEFAGGVFKSLIMAFCDSPYISPEDYADTLCGLLDVFYAIKQGTADSMTDDEAIRFMKLHFDGGCGGSLECLQDKAAMLCRSKSGFNTEEI